MAVPFEAGATFTAGARQELFQAPFAAAVRGHYRPAPDGQRFLAVASLGRDAVQAGGRRAELDGGAAEVAVGIRETFRPTGVRLE